MKPIKPLTRLAGLTLAALLATAPAVAAQRPAEFTRMPAADVATLCALHLTRMAHAMTLRDERADQVAWAWILRAYWTEQADEAGATAQDISRLKAEIAKDEDAFTRQEGYCTASGYEQFNRLGEPRQLELMGIAKGAHMRFLER